jgi:DNA-binding LytR/AlgR family response regulator
VSLNITLSSVPENDDIYSGQIYTLPPMSRINCLAIDDEPSAINVLEKYIGSVDQLMLTGTCNNAFKAMDYLHKQHIDLLFLDINMPKLSGISFIKTLAHPPKVIFTTAFKEYAVDAFELNAVDYLLKPFSFERFIQAVNKIIVIEDSGNTENKDIKISPGFLYFRSARQMVKVLLDDIVFVESLKDYVRINLLTASPLIVKQPISTLQEMLPKHLFVRIHRSFIISLMHLSAFTRHVVKVGDCELPIGRMYSHQFQQALRLRNILHSM